MKKASDLLVQCLEALQVSMIAGVPGEENADVLMSIKSSSIQFVTCFHEQTAAFMAVTHGTLTHRPGVCLATLGPGATNLITGVAQATLDGAPLVAIIGQASSTRLHKMSHQNIHSIDVFKPITKWAVTVLSADTIPEIIAKAFKIAMEERPGAVVIELPEDIAETETDACAFALPMTCAKEQVSDESIQTCLKLFAQAKKPILLLGDGATRTECDVQARQFLASTQWYCAYTFMGKGAVSHLYERSLHCVGLGMKDLALAAFEQSDLVLCVGYNFVEYPPAQWNIGCAKTIVHVDGSAAEIDEHYLPRLELVGHIPSILDQLNQQLTSHHAQPEPYFSSIQALVQKDLREDAEDLRFPMVPKRILWDIRQVLDDHDILISDVGAHKMWIARQYGARHSNTCLISNGYCSMGGSMAGAIEAQRLYPDQQVVAVCGDGGFMMSLQSLLTGVSLKIPFVVVIWQDHQYGLIKWKQEMYFHDHAFTELVYHDLHQLSLAVGAHARVVASAESFQSDLIWALAHRDKPTVLIVPVDDSEYMRLFHHLKSVVAK